MDHGRVTVKQGLYWAENTPLGCPGSVFRVFHGFYRGRVAKGKENAGNTLRNSGRVVV